MTDKTIKIRIKKTLIDDLRLRLPEMTDSARIQTLLNTSTIKVTNELEKLGLLPKKKKRR
jgi:hypothetical protein